MTQAGLLPCPGSVTGHDGGRSLVDWLRENILVFDNPTREEVSQL